MLAGCIGSLLWYGRTMHSRHITEGIMRQVAFVVAAAAFMLLAGVFAVTANATTSIGTLNLPGVAKNFSPIETVACRFSGPTCRIGYTRVCRLFSCWCARCR